MSFLVTALVALAAVGTALGAAFYFGLISGGGGVAAASPTPRGSFSVPSVVVTPSAAPSASPSPTTAPPTPGFSPGGTYTVQTGDSLSLIGDKVGVSWLLIAQANGIAGPDYVVQVGQVLVIPVATEATPGGDTYTVQSGDTITGIANKLGIDPTTFADYNNIVDWNSIAVGQILYIPKDANATPRPTETPL